MDDRSRDSQIKQRGESGVQSCSIQFQHSGGCVVQVEPQRKSPPHLLSLTVEPCNFLVCSLRTALSIRVSGRTRLWLWPYLYFRLISLNLTAIYLRCARSENCAQLILVKKIWRITIVLDLQATGSWSDEMMHGPFRYPNRGSTALFPLESCR